MSDNPREAQRAMERVFICNDIWWHCLPWLSRANIGLAFALVSNRFDRLANRYLNSMRIPWTLGNLVISLERGNAVIVKNYNFDEHLPFPEDPLPDNVIGFKHIDIQYVDQKVIDFLCRIRRLFEPTTNNGAGGIIGLELRVYFEGMRSWFLFRKSIWPLINLSSITKLHFPFNSFDEFCHYISPTFLLALANVRVVDVQFDDIRFDRRPNGRMLSKWLHTAREDGKPKLLKKYSDHYAQTVEHLKTVFLNAETDAVNFIIAIACGRADVVVPVPFEVDNLRTGERLTFRQVDNIKSINWLLERGPIWGRDAEQWAKWEREALEDGQEHNLLTVWFEDNNIGLFEENAGPSGQSQ